MNKHLARVHRLLLLAAVLGCACSWCKGFAVELKSRESALAPAAASLPEPTPDELKARITDLRCEGEYDHALLLAGQLWQIYKRDCGSSSWQAIEGWDLAERLARICRMSTENQQRLARADREEREMSAARARQEWPRVVELSLAKTPVQAELLGPHDRDTTGSIIDYVDAMREQRRYESAEALLDGVLQARLTRFGPGQPAVLDVQWAHVWILRVLRRLDELEASLRQLSEARSEVLGADNPITLLTRHNLGSLLQGRGHLEEAETIYLQVLAARVRTLGEDDLDTLRTKSNLAVLFRNRGHPERAERMDREVLAVRTRILGDDDPETLGSKNNLAAVLSLLGQLEEAESLSRELLATETQVLGKDHVDTLRTMHNLAGVLMERGKVDEAERTFRKVLAAQNRLMGENNPLTLATKNNLAWFVGSRGRLEEAEKMCREVLSARRRVLGEEDIETLSTKHNLALVLADRGQLEEAERLFREVLALRTRILGADNPDTLTTRIDFASVLEERGQLEEAERICREVLAMQSHVLGKDSIETLATRNNLASVLWDRGRLEEAENTYREALALAIRVQGEDAPDTLRTKHNFACLLKDRGQLEEAVSVLREVLAAQTNMLGDGNPRTLWSRTHLAAALQSRSNFAESGTLYASLLHANLTSLASDAPLLSERERRAVIATRSDPAYQLMSMSLLGPEVPAHDGLDGLLHYSSIAFDCERAERGAMSASPQLREIAQLRRRLAGVIYGSRQDVALTGAKDSPRDVNELVRRIETLDADLRHTDAAYAREARLREVGVNDVLSSLRPGEALLGFCLFNPLDRSKIPVKASPDAHYGVFVALPTTALSSPQQSASGETVLAMDLGPAAPIDGAIAKWRRYFEDRAGGVASEESTTARAGAEIRRLLLDPVLAKLPPDTRRLYIAPAANTCALPFEALPVTAKPGAAGTSASAPASASASSSASLRYLVENYQIVYLATGRDLAQLRIPSEVTPDNAAVLVGAPDLDATPRQRIAALTGARARDVAERAHASTSTTQAQGPAAVPDASNAPTTRPIAEPAPSDAKAIARTMGSGPDADAAALTPPRMGPLAKAAWFLASTARDIQAQDPSIRVASPWSGTEALAERVLELRSPRILQFATHGYLLPTPKDDPKAGAASTTIPAAAASTNSLRDEEFNKPWHNPLFRSMLYLSGANPEARPPYYKVEGEILTQKEAKAKGLDDAQLTAALIPASDLPIGSGLLTAYEISGMDLRGTELVGLTACQTALGSGPDGEAVGGLRRAFLMAGARSLTMTMFSVPEDQTLEQMRTFYSLWLGARHLPRGEAFHQAQIKALHDARARGDAHPYWWAGSVFIGDPGDLEPLPVLPPQNPTTPSTTPADGTDAKP